MNGSLCVGDKDVAIADAARRQRLAFDAHRIAPRATQIENGSQIDHALDVVLCRRLEAGCLVALILAHKENIQRTYALWEVGKREVSLGS